MGEPFGSAHEFRAVIDRCFAMLSDDPELGPRLRAADVPHRFEFEDMGLAVNLRPARDDEQGNLRWEWSEEADWEPKVQLRMSSETANRYFQGKENIALAITRRRIKATGDVLAAVGLLPMTKPIIRRYREVIEAEYPHLAV